MLPGALVGLVAVPSLLPVLVLSLPPVPSPLDLSLDSSPSSKNTGSENAILIVKKPRMNNNLGDKRTDHNLFLSNIIL